MTPGTIHGANTHLGPPDGWTADQCGTLPVRAIDGVIESAWYPTPEELERLKQGEPVILTVWGGRHPPVSLNVPAS